MSVVCPSLSQRRNEVSQRIFRLAAHGGVFFFRSSCRSRGVPCGGGARLREAVLPRDSMDVQPGTTRGGRRTPHACGCACYRSAVEGWPSGLGWEVATSASDRQRLARTRSHVHHGSTRHHSACSTRAREAKVAHHMNMQWKKEK